MISRMPQVLTWSGYREEMARVQEIYADLVTQSLSRIIRNMEETQPESARLLTTELHSASGSALSRVLLAPETTSRIRRFRPEGPPEAASFLTESLQAEAALGGRTVKPGKEIWTALGDAKVLPSGKVVRGPSIPGFMPLDLDSPYGMTIDVAGSSSRVPPRKPLAGTERKMVLERMNKVSRGIAATSDVVKYFVVEFTKVLVLQKDETQGFSSGSEGRYVGRSTIGNPQLPGVDELELAEAVVHEAIHSLLYMQEHYQPWALSESLYSLEQKVVSPWTGTALPVRPFLQACFVWYGVLNFWSRAALAGTFSQRMVLARINKAASGFLKGPLLSLLEKEDRDATSQEVKDAIVAMQKIVRDSATG